MNVKPDTVERIILAEAVSTTGKYKIMLAQHLISGFPCFDICAVARTSDSGGRLVARHYAQALDPKAKEHALIVWDKFRDRMCAPRTASERDEPLDPMEVIN